MNVLAVAALTGFTRNGSRPVKPQLVLRKRPSSSDRTWMTRPAKPMRLLPKCAHALRCHRHQRQESGGGPRHHYQKRCLLGRGSLRSRWCSGWKVGGTPSIPAWRKKSWGMAVVLWWLELRGGREHRAGFERVASDPEACPEAGIALEDAFSFLNGRLPGQRKCPL